MVRYIPKGVRALRLRHMLQYMLCRLLTHRGGLPPGEEASFFALVDGESVVPLVSCQDHKAVGEGDVGENTGGMGAYSPAMVVTPEIQEQAMEEIIKPTIQAMKERGSPFTGVLYAGLMIKVSSTM